MGVHQYQLIYACNTSFIINTHRPTLTMQVTHTRTNKSISHDTMITQSTHLIHINTCQQVKQCKDNDLLRHIPTDDHFKGDRPLCPG